MHKYNQIHIYKQITKIHFKEHTNTIKYIEDTNTNTIKYIEHTNTIKYISKSIQIQNNQNHFHIFTNNANNIHKQYTQRHSNT